MQKPTSRTQRAVPTSTRDASYKTQQATKLNKLRYTTILSISILVASFLAGSLREEAVMVPAQAPSPAMCSKPFKRSAKLSKAPTTIAQAFMHNISHNSQTSRTATDISGRWSYWAQDLHSSAFSITGQAETLDPFQRALAHQLLPQQSNNSDADLAKLPHCKGKLVALQAVHSPDTTGSGLGAPSIIRSKRIKSARRNKDGLQRRRMTDSQKVLPWQAALMMNLDVQISNPSTTLAQQQETVTCDMPACYLPSTIHRSNTNQLKVASVVQNPQTRADNRATNGSVSMQYCSQHLSTDVHHANSPTKLVWHVLHKSAVHDSDHLLMSWPLDHVEHMLLTAPTTPCLACLAAVRAIVTDHLSKMHLQATLKCMASYLLAFTLLTALAAKFLLMIIWVSLTMFATALQTTHRGLGMHRRQIRTPWLAQMIQCIAHMVWLLLMILRHAASSVHSIAAMYSAIMFVKTQHALIM